MTQNNEILNRIMGNATPAPQEVTETSSLPPTTRQAVATKEENVIPKTRIITARYKVYAGILFLVLLWGWMDFFPKIHTNYKSAGATYESIKQNIQALQNQKSAAQRDKTYLEEIESHQETLETCLNKEDTSACTSLPESWNVEYQGKTIKDFSVPLSYLQLNSLYAPKMPVDEKKVLRNLNEYLIRNGIVVQNVNVKNGDIKNITIGESSPFPESSVLFSVPLTLSLEFKGIDDLISFVHNVEKKLISVPSDRILYKIQEIGYDIIAANKPQTAEVSMIAYYYHDPRFQDVEPTIPEASSSSETSTE
ncbi:MAG: hypothetical protein LBP53_03825 [Candidatus Peribacteria bacterium]|jgi:hypothetical protein|nr:hypothetical protein [Candidatus Peribacteria bacterium]